MDQTTTISVSLFIHILLPSDPGAALKFNKITDQDTDYIPFSLYYDADGSNRYILPSLRQAKM